MVTVTKNPAVPPLGRHNHAQWLTAMRENYHATQAGALFVGQTLVLSDTTEVEVIHIEPHREFSGRLIKDWITVTYLDAGGRQERRGYWVHARVFIPRRSW